MYNNFVKCVICVVHYGMYSQKRELSKELYLMLTPTGMSGGLRRSVDGDRQAGDDAPLLAPDV